MRSKKIRRFIVSASSVLTIAVIFSFSCLQSKAADWLPALSGTVSPELGDFVGNITYSDSVDPINFSYTLANEESSDPQRGWVTGSGSVRAGAIVVFVNIDLEQAGFRDVGPGRGFVIKGRFGYSPAASPLPSDSVGQISVTSGEYIDVQNLVYQSFHFESDNVSGITTLGSQGMYVMDYELQLFVPLYNEDGTPNTSTYDQVDLAFRITPGETWFYPFMYFSPVSFSEYDDVTIYNFGNDFFNDHDSGIIIDNNKSYEAQLDQYVMDSWSANGILNADFWEFMPSMSHSLRYSFSKLGIFTSSFANSLGDDFEWFFKLIIVLGATGLVVSVVSVVPRAIKNLSVKDRRDDDK